MINIKILLGAIFKDSTTYEYDPDVVQAKLFLMSDHYNNLVGDKRKKLFKNRVYYMEEYKVPESGSVLADMRLINRKPEIDVTIPACRKEDLDYTIKKWVSYYIANKDNLDEQEEAAIKYVVDNFNNTELNKLLKVIEKTKLWGYVTDEPQTHFFLAIVTDADRTNQCG